MNMRLLAISFLFFSLGAFSQKKEVFQIDSLPKEGILLDKGWKWYAGDNPDFADADFDDSGWEGIDPTKDIYYLPQIRKSSVGWLRIRLDIDSALLNKALAFQIKQTAASEVFLNGILLSKFGVISTKSEEVKAFDPSEEPIGLLFSKKKQVLAIRFSIQEKLPYFSFNSPFQFFLFRIKEVKYTDRLIQRNLFLQSANFIYFGFFLLLGIIHLGFYFTFRKQKANLYFSLFAFSACIANLLYVYTVRNNDITIKVYTAIIDYILLFSFFGLFLMLAIYQLFPKSKGFYFWLIIIYLLIGFILGFYTYKWVLVFGYLIPHFLANIASFRITLSAYLKGGKAVGLLVFGIGSYIVLYFAFLLTLYGILPSPKIGFGFVMTDLYYHLSIISISLSFSIYLAREFAFTSMNLEIKLEEVKQLSSEKQQILATQNEILEKQVKARTAELKASQNQLIQSEKLASLGELTAGIAHEIQNPLNFVNNFSEMSVELIEELKSPLTPEGGIKPGQKIDMEVFEDLTQNLEKITLHGKRASSIVKGMLEHSRTSTGEKELTDINALADEYLRLAYHGLRAKDQTFNSDFKTDFDESLPKIKVIPQDIGRVLLNLINNAFYATKGVKNPLVEIKTASVENGIIVSVNDNGSGMSEATKAKIFQPFFTTKPTGEGTGLGLSLAYDIVTKGHGGTLDCESVIGEGTTFIVKIPFKTN